MPGKPLYLLLLFIVCLGVRTNAADAFRQCYVPLTFMPENAECDGSMAYFSFPVRVRNLMLADYQKTAEGKGALGKAFVKYLDEKEKKRFNRSEKDFFSQVKVFMEFKMGKWQGIFWGEAEPGMEISGRMQYVFFDRQYRLDCQIDELVMKDLVLTLTIHIDRNIFPNLFVKPKKKFRAMITVDLIRDEQKKKPYAPLPMPKKDWVKPVEDGFTRDGDPDGLYLLFDADKIDIDLSSPAEVAKLPVPLNDYFQLMKPFFSRDSKDWQRYVSLHSGADNRMVDPPLRKRWRQALMHPRCVLHWGSKRIFFYEFEGRVALTYAFWTGKAYGPDNVLQRYDFFWGDTFRSIPIIEAVLGKKLPPPPPLPKYKSESEQVGKELFDNWD